VQLCCFGVLSRLFTVIYRFHWLAFLVFIWYHYVMALVGFCGSRSLSPRFRGLVSRVVSAVVASGRGVAVGCASGADAFAGSACSGSAVVFRASAFGVGRASFARRSAALVSAVAVSGVGCGLVAFVSSACPRGLFPSASSSACFAGFGSGSWASVALAVGSGVPVVVFPCGLPPSSSLPSWSGSWVACSGSFTGGFRFVPAAASLPF
jgi:hypothetical protein